MRARKRLLWLSAVALCGCSRTYYREQADNDTQSILRQRGYDIGGTNPVRPSTSRLYDPGNEDYPPKPPDDPQAVPYMANPNGIRGSKKWYDWGWTDEIEWNGWEASLPRDDKGVVRVDPDKSVELALMNSREYQTAVEDVFLSALGLTLNRFEFQLHWFGKSGALYTHFGSSSLPNESNTLDAVTMDYGFNRNLAAGGQLLVEFLNNVFIQFTGPDKVRVGSNFIVNFLQPLLRGAGRYVRLENLTQAERDVLYAVRDFARFRKQFWVDIATTGYLNLLLQEQGIRNLKSNLKSQEQNLRLHEELFKGGKKSVVEVDQVFTAYQQGLQAIIDAEAAYQTSLDSFKIQLGLPPRLPVALDDRLLDRFQLLSPELEAEQKRIEKFQEARLLELEKLPGREEQAKALAELADLVKRLPAVIEPVEKEWTAWGERAKDAQGKAKEAYEDFRQQFDKLRREQQALLADIAKERNNLSENALKESWDNGFGYVRKATGLVDTLSNIQIQVRIYRIELQKLDETEDSAVAYAHEHRLDLMNVKARVTDSWRKVQVAANALKGDLNVSTTMALRTDPNKDNPLNFAAENSVYTVGIQLDTPLNRLAERNVFRTSLITYQRSRRDFMALNDRIDQSLRRDLRFLEAAGKSFEISRSQLLIAARRVEATRQELLLVTKNTGNDAGTINVLNALQALLDARNGLARSFINYEQLRIQTLLDMEQLQVDDKGLYSPDAANPGAFAPFLSGDALPRRHVPLHKLPN